MPSDSSPRNWWPLSKQEKTRGLSLNSIASAIGLKSKKQRPSLAIQDPPSPLLTSPSTTTLVYTNTPSLSAHSRVDSTGPPTPVDYQGQSLLTFPETDPFTGRPLTIPPVPQIPQKKNPLSVDTSVVHRISCASSSSLSTNHACDSATLSPAAGLTEFLKLSNKRSIKNIQISRSAGSTDPSIHHTSLSPSLSSKRPGSSSTIVSGGQTPYTLPRPKLRARGMTDGGGTRKAGFFSDELPASKNLSKKLSTSTFSSPTSSTEHTSPRVVVRQPSFSRSLAPPCAPPAHSLPATPYSSMKVSSSMQRSDRFTRTESLSSSCVSFVSSCSNEMLPALSHPLREKRYSEHSVFSQDHDPEISSNLAKRESKTAPSSPRILKKPLSHQSLTGKSIVHPPTLPKPPPDNKVFRKQRTLHHTRSPMPFIPDPVGQPSSPNSTTFPSLTDVSPKVANERRESGNSSLGRNCSLGRKRLFSHSSTTRPSTSHCTPAPAMTEDDSQSVFSLRSDLSSHFVPFKPWASSKAARDEAASPVPSSPARSEYTPQPILSAAEVAKLEASVENSSERSIRSRAFSLLSASTAASDRDDLDLMPAGLSPPPTRPRSKQGSMTGKSSAIKNPVLYSPASSRARSPPRSPPPSNNGNPVNDSRSTTTYQPFSSQSETLLTTSLPPPPRSRKRSQLVSHPERSNTELSDSSSVAKRSRSKSSIERGIHHRSIMRKPSFLEIDDDTDQDLDLFSGEEMTQSFLDLARESFEINHSNDP